MVEDSSGTPVEKALKKARHGAKLAQRDNAPRASIEPSAPAADPAVPPAPLKKINYSKTRVEAVSPEILEANRLVAGVVRSSLADSYRMLRAQVLKKLKAMDGGALAVCSANEGEGKTLTAANLAISIAMEPNHTVVLVDLDLRRPRMHEYFGIRVERGLCDYLEGAADISEVLVNPGIDALTLLPVRRALLNSSELLSSARMKHLLAELKGRYPDRIVIFDLPPLLASDDSMVVLHEADASLLVIREGNTKAGEIQRGLKLLDDHNLVGTVLNDSTELDLHPYY